MVMAFPHTSLLFPALAGYNLNKKPMMLINGAMNPARPPSRADPATAEVSEHSPLLTVI
jgi:hypothetical protein